MEVDPNNKPAEELGEEDLVDYEEEEDTAQAEKHTENGKDTSKKYAATIILFPYFSYFPI
jgi:hypothetical protein